MHRLIAPIVALLLFVPVLVGGCAWQQEEPAVPEKPVEEPASPEKPPSLPGDEDNDKLWKEVNQLEQEKTTTLIIEGMEEQILLQLQISSLYPYAIYLDEDRYHMEQRDDKDLILPRAEVKPEVFMAIWHREDVEISALISELEEKLKGKHAIVHVQGRVEKPLPAHHLYAVNGDAWDDTVERYYLVEDFEGGVIVIQQKLFKEAVEGHGARFDGMLNELYIWNPGTSNFSKP